VASLLCPTGLAAHELAPACGGGGSKPPWSAAVLKEMNDLGLALELVATAGAEAAADGSGRTEEVRLAMMEEMRKAGVPDVPDPENLEDTLGQCSLSIEKLRTQAVIDVTNQQMKDAEGLQLCWYVARFCSLSTATCHRMGCDFEPSSMCHVHSCPCPCHVT
jgi:hypothetical protein